MKNKSFIFLIVLAVVGLFVSIAITKAIVNADIPEWLKFWLLTQ